VDPGQQAIKVNPDVTDLGVVDFGTIQCSHLELTDAGRSHIRDDCYTGGIDMHAATGWVVRRNFIEGFWCSAGLSEHGIHFWRECVDTLVEENVIVDCVRGIGFGLGYGTVYGHVGGIIRNNFVTATRDELFLPPHLNEYGFDTGISLESAAGAAVYNNTVFSDDTPRSSSIEWRWDLTTAEIANNLTSHTQISRDGGVATVNTGNRTGALGAWFVDPANGDLHLTSASLPPVDGGTALDSGDCDNDHDGQLRVDNPDQGADEWGDAHQPLFVDGFELGHTLMWSSTVG
jgi:hypothetical protein